MFISNYGAYLTCNTDNVSHLIGQKHCTVSYIQVKSNIRLFRHILTIQYLITVYISSKINTYMSFVVKLLIDQLIYILFSFKIGICNVP